LTIHKASRGSQNGKPGGSFEVDHRNNFDLIRLFGAFQVVLAHSASHLGLDASSLAWRVLLLIPGVPVFFVTSGFLVSASLDRSESLATYSRNRALRIFPALWVCFAVTLVLLGVTGQLDSEFLSTSFWLWSLAQLTIGQSYNPAALRDFGVGVVNGSLWTIPVELSFYIALPFAMMLRKTRTGLIVLTTAITVSLTSDLLTHERATFLTKLISVSPVAHIWLFLLGMLAYEYRTFVIPKVSDKFLWLFGMYITLALFLQTLGGPWIELGFPLLALVVLSAAYTGRSLSQTLLRRNDISYGVYIYHMVVINAVIAYDFASRQWAFFAVLALSSVLAVGSWIIVERPALRLKTYRRKQTTQTVRATR
jgi:peptidoglycan/LPS O-acetylase OafA/YrhL